MALTNVDLYRIDGTIGSVSNVQTAAINGGPISGARNRIINGDMRIDQRNAGSSVTIGAASLTYTLDRFAAYGDQASKFSVQRSTTASAGFTNSLLVTSLSAYSVTTSDRFNIRQHIEGFNVADLAWGTASAQSVTLSFWVRSSLTGTFGGSIRNSAGTRSYPFTYTISAANTFEYKTITIPGETTGTWLTDNGIGMTIFWGLGVGATNSGTAGAWASADYVSATGSTSVVGTNGATFYITGVQLETGTTATPFERRSYGQELALCQRYYYKNFPGAIGCILTQGGNCDSTTVCYGAGCFPVPMRIRPTSLEQSGTAGDYTVYHSATSTICSAVPSYNSATSALIYVVSGTVASGFTANRPANLAVASVNGFLAWSAEL